MTAIALTLLFTSTGLFALASIAATLHRYGASAVRLHKAVRASAQERELRFAITEFRVTLAEKAQILRPDFEARATAPWEPAQLHAAA
jgi:hypothetical protein